MNRGVAERAVLHYFLAFSSEHSAAQWRAGSRHFLFPECYCEVLCCMKQLLNAARRVNGSQSDKRRAVMLYRVCFHTCSQTAGWIYCSCLTAQQTDRPVAASELTGQLDRARPGLQVPSRLLPDQLSCQSNVSLLLAYRAVSLGSD